MSGTGGLSGAGRPRSCGLTPWLSVAVSVLGSAAAVVAAGSLCALLYPVLRELRAGRLTAENGAEEKMLGFWSVLVISAAAGCVSWISSWILSCLEAYQPGAPFPGPPSLLHPRDASGAGLDATSGLAVLNGVLAMLTVIWSLC